MIARSLYNVLQNHIPYLCQQDTQFLDLNRQNGKIKNRICAWYCFTEASVDTSSKTSPEHFSTPLAFAQQHFDLDAELIPIPTGTGDLVKGLKATEGDERLDVAIGLTEGFVADLGKSKAAGAEPGFGLVGTYVESPLRWAISTGAERKDVTSVDDLKGGKVGVSRIGRYARSMLHHTKRRGELTLRVTADHT